VQFLTSLDGITWKQPTGAQNNINAAYSVPPTLGTYREKFVLGATQALYKSPGVTYTAADAMPTDLVWTEIGKTGNNFEFLQNFHITKVIEINGLMVVAGFDLDGITNVYAYYSYDEGYSWSKVAGGPTSTTGPLNRYTINDIKLISPTIAMMVGSVYATPQTQVPLILISINGTTWTRINSGYGLLANPTNQTQIKTFSGTYSEFVLFKDKPISLAPVVLKSSTLSMYNSYNSPINAIPTYAYIPYVNVLPAPSSPFKIQLTMTLTQGANFASSTPVASGTFMLTQTQTQYVYGISIPLTANANVFIAKGTTVFCNLSVLSTGVGSIAGASINLKAGIGLAMILYGRTNFLPSTLTLPSAATTSWYIPSPITYLNNKKIYGKKIAISMPAKAATDNLIKYNYTTNGSDTFVLANNNPATPETEMLQLTLGTTPATINIIASYTGDNANAATSVTTTVYAKNYISLTSPSSQTAMFINKSGGFVNVNNTISVVAAGGIGVMNALPAIGASAIINITNPVTLYEFNFGYVTEAGDKLGLAGYSTGNNPQTFIMTVKNVSNPDNPKTITTVLFGVTIPPFGAQGAFVPPVGAASQYYAATYNQNVGTNEGYNDGTLMSIPFYDISNNLPSYVTSFQILGSPLPTFNLGDSIQITLSSNANFFAHTTLTNGSLCGALIATPTEPINYNWYKTQLSSLTNIVTDNSSSITTTATTIGTFAATTLIKQTIVTGFIIQSMGLGTGTSLSTVILTLNVFKNSTNVLFS
jgi:hypothetical protein